MSNPLVIYHAKCPDGMAAAWAAWMIYRPLGEYLPASYGDPPPADEAVAGRDVILVDFSYPRDALVRLHKAARSLLVLRAIASLQQELRATVEGVYREKMLANEIPRLWIDRTRWAAIVEAQRCAIALVSKMASAGPDWSASIEAERVALVEALASLNAGDHQ